MHLEMPLQVQKIIARLEAAGFEGYAVGGCVRDSVLGRVPNDWDITTSALPEQIKELFHHTVDTGIEHGTVTVLLDGGSYEITTYRLDGVYEDARHPKNVTFTSSLVEDLRRRDFTINAMAYNDQTGLVDAFGGLEDLREGLIRCVGNAKDRFSEDALRIMRAVRFAAQLGFEIEEETARAAKDFSEALRKISAERIQTELVKLLVSDHPDWIEAAWRMGITAVILPEFDAVMKQPENTDMKETVGQHILKTLPLVPADRILRLTMLLHDLGKPAAAAYDGDGLLKFTGHARVSAAMGEQIMRRLKMDRDTIRKVTVLIRCHSDWPDGSPADVRRAVYRTGEDLFPLYLQVKYADVMSREGEKRETRMKRLETIRTWYGEILERGDCLSLRQLKLTGNDLIQDGMKPGVQIGQVLLALLEEVFEDPAANDHDRLLQRSRELRGGEGAHCEKK